MSSETALVHEKKNEPNVPEYQVRTERLRAVLKLAVDQTVKRLMEPEDFKKCFSKMVSIEGAEAAIELGRKQVAQYFTTISLEQFEHIFAERGIKERLDDLDDVIHSAQERKATNTGGQILLDELSAESVITTAVTKLKHSAIEKLQVIYDQLCKENTDLYERLKEHTETCENLKNEVVSLVDSLQSGIDEIKRINFELLLEKLAEEVFGD